MPPSRPFLSLLPGWLALASLVSVLVSPAPAAAQTGNVSGTVTSVDTGAPIANLQVSVVTLSGSNVATGVTNGAGEYSIAVQPGAVYYVTAQSSFEGYLPEAFPDVQCVFFSCSSTDLREAEPFAMTAGATVSGRNFQLARGGSISGTVASAAGAGIANASVTAWVRLGNQTFGRTTGTSAAGAFSIPNLPPGTYYLSSSNSAGFRNEIHGDVPCVGACTSANALASGTPIPVALGSTVTGRDFSLETGGTLSGVVTNAATGQPLQNVFVSAYTRIGSTVVFGGGASTNATGAYTITGLAAATYGVSTGSNTMVNEIYGDILCAAFCNTNATADSGTGVAVSLGSTASGVNLALDPGQSISGTVTNEATGLPVQSMGVTAWVQVGPSLSGRTATTNASGAYTISGLLEGTYVLSTNAGNFANEVFDNIPCTGFCDNSVLLTGTPITVAPGTPVSGRNFSLQPNTIAGGTLTGTVTDAASGLPIASLPVTIGLQTGSGLSSFFTVTTNLSGTYSASGLRPGSYRASTSGNHPYRNEAFDNFPCFSGSCSTTIIASSTPISVSAGGTATANFGLSAGDGISGTVTDAATGSPLPGVNVSVYHVASGQFAGAFISNLRGQYFVRGLPNGEYVALTSNSQGFFDEIHNNIRCTTSCSSATAVASGTRITVSGAAAFAGADLAELVTGISFALDVRDQAPGAPSNLRIVTSGGTGQFTWSAPSLSAAAAPTSYRLAAGLSPGTTFITLPIPGTATSFAVPGVPPGTFYVRIHAVNAFGVGPASNEVMLVVGATGVGLPETPTSLVAFTAGGLLTMTWSPGLGGGPASGYVVEAGSTSGSSNIATLNVVNESFTFSPVPPGFYFLRVRARNAAGVSPPTAEVMVVVGNVPAPPGAPNLSFPGVAGSTVTLTWQAPQVGTATSYIIEAGSAAGLADLAVVNTGTTALTQSFAGVPSGTYYVRVRAVNAQGASVVSNERTIIVP
jgi:hypothetical protein